MMYKTIKLWEYYKFPKPIQNSIMYFARDCTHNGSLYTFDLNDFSEANISDKSEWSVEAFKIREYFLEHGCLINETVYIHISW